MIGSALQGSEVRGTEKCDMKVLIRQLNQDKKQKNSIMGNGIMSILNSCHTPNLMKSSVVKRKESRMSGRFK